MTYTKEQIKSLIDRSNKEDSSEWRSASALTAISMMMYNEWANKTR